MKVRNFDEVTSDELLDGIEEAKRAIIDCHNVLADENTDYDVDYAVLANYTLPEYERHLKSLECRKERLEMLVQELERI